MLQQKFDKFHEENPHVYEMFKSFALGAIRLCEKRNKKYISADFIMHRVRWEQFTTTDKDFKINNNHISYYSRLFQKDFQEYSHMFRNRKTEAEKAEKVWY